MSPAASIGARPQRRRLLATLALSGLASLAACAPVVVSAPAPAKDTVPDNSWSADSHGWFQADHQWVGDFPDPHVVRVGNVYYAFSTATGGRQLPVLMSVDLKTWKTHPNWSYAAPFDAPGYDVDEDTNIPAPIRQSKLSDWEKYHLNDALVTAPSWGVPNTWSGNWISRDMWAPGVGQVGNRWVAYYAVKESDHSDDPYGSGRYCLSMAYGPSALGPFTDASGGGPIQCQPSEWDPAGSIDPFPYHHPVNGKKYLLWKAAGKVGSHPSALMSVELGDDGRPKWGAPWVKLLETSAFDWWEGDTIENPGMIFHNGMTYLFYSANYWGADGNGASAYAMGYAACPFGPAAPCVRLQSNPLLASTGEMQGPGGSAPFHATDGSLKLAYHAYTHHEQRHPRPRRLHIGNIHQAADWRLTFVGDV